MQHSQNASGPQATREVVRAELSLYGSEVYESLWMVDIPSLPVDPNFPLSRKLVSLTLYKRGPDSHIRPKKLLDLTTLIEVLRCMPLLKVFAMHNILVEPSRTFKADLIPIMPIELRDLETLYFHSSHVANYRWFMQKLNYNPSLLKIVMETECGATELGAEHSKGLQLIPSDIASSVGEIEVANDTDSFTVSGWRREAGQRLPHATFSATITVRVSSGLTKTQGTFAFVSEHRLSLLSVGHLQFSWIKASWDSTNVSRDWAPLLWMLPGLKSITASYMASGWHCIGIAEALAAKATVSGNTEFTCPELRRLKFRSVVFEPGLVEFIETLASTLELRHKYNMRCEELCIGSGDQKIPCDGPDDFQALRGKDKESLICRLVKS